jgi:hypothetical protein
VGQGVYDLLPSRPLPRASDVANEVAWMKRASPSSLLISGLLLAWAIFAPPTVHAWVLVVKNMTNDTMGVCYIVHGMGSVCFGTFEVPPYGTVTATTGTSCVGRWKVTRVRDGQVQALSRPSGPGCGDRQLFIRPDGPGFSLGTP